jgi:hypothetical protein
MAGSAMTPMKLVFVIIEEGIRADVMEILKAHGAEHYTAWAQIEGSGETGLHQGNPVWPGLNDVIMVAIPEETVKPLIAEMHELRDSLPIVPGMRFIICDAQFV